jgi:4-hydroxy-3-methylbut-2-enyl diphosphate reductase IspH
MGDIKHPEVIGIAGNCKGKVKVASNSDELLSCLREIGDSGKNIYLVAQTTFIVIIG